MPESKEENNNTSDTLDAKSQSCATTLFGAATITQQPIKDSSSNTSLSRKEIISIKSQNPVVDLRRLVKSHGMSGASRSSISSVVDSNLKEDSMRLLIKQLKFYTLRDDLL